MKVHILFGLGFGDDESAWEVLSVHKTNEGAEAAKKKVLENCDDDTLQLKIEDMPLQM